MKKKFPIAVIPYHIGNSQNRFLHRQEIMAIQADARIEMAKEDNNQKVVDKQQDKQHLVSQLARPRMTSPQTFKTRPATAMAARTTRPGTAKSKTSVQSHMPMGTTNRLLRRPLAGAHSVSKPLLARAASSQRMLGKAASTTKLTWRNKESMLKLESRKPDFSYQQSEFTHELEEQVNDEKLRINCYKGDYAYGKRNGLGRIVYENGDIYKGEWYNNLRHGEGKYIYAVNGVKYKGSWQHNKKNGTGIWTFPNGDKFTCEWAKDNTVQTHHGRIDFQNGTLYQGELDDCERNGEGLQHYENGCTYQGHWHADCRDGYGLISFYGDCFFEGCFNHDRTGGTGVLVLKNRLESLQTVEINIYDKKQYFDRIDHRLQTFRNYIITSKDIIWLAVSKNLLKRKFPAIWETFSDGYFQNGKLYGCGIVKYGTFGYYMGTFEDGMKSGHGEMVYSDPERYCTILPENNAKYIGQWKKDERHGTGQWVWPETKYRYKGQWRHDQRHKVTGIMYFSKKEWYEGEWNDNLMDGEGVYHYSDGNVFKGKFTEGHQNNIGIIEFKNGMIYEGKFWEMIPHGRGKMLYKDGSTYDGHFKLNKRHGQGKLNQPNGDYYSGRWKGDTKDGWGLMYYSATGEEYDGEWTWDKRDGFGTLTNKKRETMYKGQWRNDLKDGPGRIVHTTELKDPKFYENS